MRQRDSGLLRAEIAAGHISTNYCHLANISYRTGNQQSIEEVASAVKDEPALAESFQHRQHLAANEIDLARTPLVLGGQLTFDPVKETFTGAGASAASEYLRREYRAPFVVPENV